MTFTATFDFTAEELKAIVTVLCEKAFETDDSMFGGDGGAIADRLRALAEKVAEYQNIMEDME